MNPEPQPPEPSIKMDFAPRVPLSSMERIRGAEKASLVGMLLGWMVMNSVLGVVTLVGSAIPRGFRLNDLKELGGFMGIFGVCSAVVCFVVWMFVAWPITGVRWKGMVLGEASWQVHGVYGGVSGLMCGVVVGLLGNSLPLGATFGGLACIAGAVCGTWAGWKARQTGIRMRMERGELP